ncbi:MAG: efflux RND transporter periplasmic adaptor subunit, partial [Pseudomonadota bacterium]|nr:efflux RND transporter periplasmic adaptor subunit [Pseudomonadota bacterium]
MMRINMRSVYCYVVLSLVLTACNRTEESAIEHAEKHLDPTYVCPMHPQIVRDEPGSCPICGMDLVKKQPENKQTAEQHPSVTLSAGTIQNMGVRTQKVQRGALSRIIQTVGYVTYDENKIAHLHPRSKGWVEKLKVRAEGDVVQADQVLLEMYSPEIFAAQEEFLVSLRVGNSKLLGENVTAINTIARQKLRLLAVPEAVINTLIDTGQAVGRIPLLAPQAGIITQ